MQSSGYLSQCSITTFPSHLRLDIQLSYAGSTNFVSVGPFSIGAFVFQFIILIHLFIHEMLLISRLHQTKKKKKSQVTNIGYYNRHRNTCSCRLLWPITVPVSVFIGHILHRLLIWGGKSRCDMNMLFWNVQQRLYVTDLYADFYIFMEGRHHFSPHWFRFQSERYYVIDRQESKPGVGFPKCS